MYLSPIEIFNLWLKMNFLEYFTYEVFGIMKSINELDGWNSFLLFSISMLRNL